MAVLDGFSTTLLRRGTRRLQLVPIEDLDVRVAAWREVSGKRIAACTGDLLDAGFDTPRC